MSALPAVSIDALDLTHRYGRRSVLDRMRFSCEAPSVVAIRGANGSGKSTSGALRLRVDGRDVGALDRHRWLGYAGPELAFYPELTAHENLGFAAETRGLPAPKDQARAALEQVGLASRAGDRVGALSSGMVQRLRLAFALLADAPLLLLDEPGSHMDEEGRGMLSALVDGERGRRLVVIATNEEREGALADRTIELQGRGLGHPA